ncbi:MAG: glycosyltransferase family 4 protein [Verrucomicrobia bacterium]|nr:glycosyltransferase family 4 protein [Verrucomicrobiota bacterium]
MKIAIASSGLGHVTRGIETWALDTAVALAEAGVDVTLFCAGPVKVSPSVAAQLTIVQVDALRRTDAAARWRARVSPSWTWRWGWRSTYGWEQWSFWLRIWLRLRVGAFHILHVQDPLLAYFCRRFRDWGWLQTREILAHGTEESLEFLAGFDRVQHLAPWHLDETLKGLKSRERDPRRPLWVAIPNFVDTETFSPRQQADDRRAWRQQHDIPEEALVLGCAAAIKKVHKRIDYLIDEFGAFARQVHRAAAGVPTAKSTETYLVIVGSRQADTDELIARAHREARGHVRILQNLPREDMPTFYHAIDCFVLTSLFEMMPIALLEALASGVPLLVNDHPVLSWMIGPGGACIDMTTDGALSNFLSSMRPAWLTKHGPLGRAHAVEHFSKTAVVANYIAYYERVIGE